MFLLGTQGTTGGLGSHGLRRVRAISMTAIYRRIRLCCCALAVLSGVYCLLHEAAHRSGEPKRTSDHVATASPSSSATAQEKMDRFVESAMSVLARAKEPVEQWGTVALLGGTGVLALYLCSLAVRVRRDLRLLRAGINQLDSKDFDLDAKRFSIKEIAECAGDLACIADQIHAEKGRLTQDAARDPLTGLPNRRVLVQRLAQEVAAAKRTGWPVSVIMADLDHFKNLNDTYGHQAGDFVLKRTSERMASLVRESDTVARYGGEEFAVILPRASLAEAMEIAQQLCDAIRCGKLVVDRQSIPVSASFGVAELQECRVNDPDSLMKCADLALYQAKEAGRDTVVAAPAADDEYEQVEEGEVAETAIESPDREPHSFDDGKQQSGGQVESMALMGSTFSLLRAIPDRHRVANDMLQQVAALLECRRLSLYMRDGGHGGLVEVASVGSSGYDAPTDSPVPTGLDGWLNDLRSSGRLFTERTVELVEVAGAPGHASSLRIPLAARDELVGLIDITDGQGQLELNERNRTLLSGICLIGAAAMSSCEIFKGYEGRWTGLIEALCAIIHREDLYKRNHSARVSDMCDKISRQLGQVDEDRLRLLRIAGMLHDVGETEVPKGILQKRGTLRDKERLKIQEHCRIGAAIIEGAGCMTRLVEIVLHHHEHYDGTGYPDGLMGDQIPLGSRIIAVAAAYSSMTADRPYRPKMSDGVAFERIRAAAGSQFDPVVVNAFMECHVAGMIGTKSRRRVAARA